VASKLSVFLAELKRRKVTRVAVVYVLVGLGAIEAVDIIGSRLLFPEWAIQFVIVLVLIGFPIALVLAWALEVTPQGIQKTADLTPEQLASHTPNKWRASSWVLAGVGLVVVLGAGYFMFFRGGEEPALPEEAVVESLPEDYVAVFPFRNLTSDSELDDVGSAVAFMITDGISRVDGIRVVATNTVEQTVMALGEGGSELEAAASLGVGIAVTGVITRQGDSLQLRAQITHVETGEVFQSVDAAGAIDQRMEVVENLRDRVLGTLAASLDAFLSDFVSSAPTMGAFREYQRGSEIFMTGDFAGSLPYFHRAYQLDGTFIEPLVSLMAAYFYMGRAAEKDSVARIMGSRRDELSRDNQLLLGSFEADGWVGALQVFRVLAQRDPVSWGFELAELALNAGRPAEGLVALEGIDPDSPYASLWAPFWDRLARANHLTGRYQEALEATRQGQERFPEHLELRHLEARALIAMDRLDEIGPLLDTVEGMESQGGLTPGSIFRQVGIYLARHGHSEESRALAERALDWYLSRDPDGYQGARAGAMLLADRPEDAMALLGPLVEQDPENVDFHGRYGITLALTGDQEGAEAEARWLEELDRPYLHGDNTYWRAAILAHLDRRDEAVRVLRQAFQEERSWLNALADPNFRPLWDYDPYEDLIAPKG